MFHVTHYITHLHEEVPLHMNLLTTESMWMGSHMPVNQLVSRNF